MPTRLAILSDIHSNVFALRGVLADVRAAGVDEVLLLGDLFGYYPWARETWEEVATLSPVSVLGNHDQLVLGAAAGEPPPDPPPEYYPAAAQNARELPAAGLEWLGGLPHEHSRRTGGWWLRMVHGTPADPLEGRFYPDDRSLPSWLPKPDELLLLGHTHYPLLRSIEGGGVLFNPGSVGQPRDGDPRASWGLVELEGEGAPRISLRRVPYDVPATMERLQGMGWPRRFIQALNKTAPGPLTLPAGE